MSALRYLALMSRIKRMWPAAQARRYVALTLNAELKGRAYGPDCHLSTVRCDHDSHDGGVGLHVRPSPSLYLLEPP